MSTSLYNNMLNFTTVEIVTKVNLLAYLLSTLLLIITLGSFDFKSTEVKRYRVLVTAALIVISGLPLFTVFLFKWYIFAFTNSENSPLLILIMVPLNILAMCFYSFQLRSHLFRHYSNLNKGVIFTNYSLSRVLVLLLWLVFSLPLIYTLLTSVI